MVHRAEAVVDLSAADATVAYTIDAPGAGHIYVGEVFGRFEEAVAAGGFTTTAGVLSLEVGGNEVGTWSTGVASTGRAIGDTLSPLLTVDGTYATDTNSAVAVAAGDVISVKTKTQGVDGTVTGTVRLYIPCDFDLS